MACAVLQKVRTTKTHAVAPEGKTPPENREFQYSYKDFQSIRRLIHERAGISLSELKQDMVYSRLARRLRVHGLRRFTEYLELLRLGDETEWEAFTNALTTNLTSFFREAHHFELLARHAARRKPGRDFHVWCCGCSSGEEAYSIAMTLAETSASLTPAVSILASDVDTQVLRKAEEGVYPMERVERLGPERVRRFFLRGTGVQAGQAKVRPELRALIDFRPLNLLAPAWPLHKPLDAIFCRNVMIYFDRTTQAAILRRFAPLLRPDGLLFVGHSESLFHVSETFRLRGKTVYELAN